MAGDDALFADAAYVRLQSTVLHRAGLALEEVQCVLDDFPLVPEATRDAIRSSAA
jgi:hypothetical protein